MVERVHFPGDPQVGSSVPQGGKENPQIPLTQSVQRTTQELIDHSADNEEANKAKDFRPVKGKGKVEEDDDDMSDSVQEGPEYNRERIGARIGQPIEEAAKIEEYERELDQELVVPCMFQTPVHLNHGGLMHHWQPGVHLVPLSIAGNKEKGPKMHWWLRQNKVKRSGPPQKNPRLASDDDDDDVAA